MTGVGGAGQFRARSLLVHPQLMFYSCACLSQALFHVRERESPDGEAL